ncbi:MAG TPA: OmpA family protein [Bacteroidia bacterium]|jgi:chemotaxis protein MotB|nr:OmpA family protein [Bacteroidia bacterium]
MSSSFSSFPARLAFVFVLSTLFLACVPQRQLEEERNKRKSCETELNATKTSKQAMETELNETKGKLIDGEKRLAGLRNDTNILGTSLRLKTDQYVQLMSNYELLLRQNKELRNGMADENSKLSGQLNTTQEELLRKQDELKKLGLQLDQKQKDLDQKQKDLDGLNVQLKQRETRVTELENTLKQKDQAVSDLKKKITDALLGFEGKGLTVTQKNGKVYVSMDESLLFASGSTKVEAKGEEALKNVAKVLEQNKDINVLVEGHTDDVPMKGHGDIKDNWDLSTIRATSIVKILVSSADVDPKRLTAAGRGEYFPLDPAKTAEARKKNRRTEIILTPKMDDLFKALETN